MIPARGPQTMFSVSLKVNNFCNAICAMQSRNIHANVYTCIDTHTYKYPQMCLLCFCDMLQGMDAIHPQLGLRGLTTSCPGIQAIGSWASQV